MEALIQEVIDFHPGEYFPADNWQERAVQVLEKSLPKPLAALLDEMLSARLERQDQVVTQPEDEEDGDPRKLGWKKKEK